MSHAEIALVYEGPAVESGLMDVRDLAPALLAFGNLVEAANRIVNGDNATAKVQVRTVGAGSFSIGLLSFQQGNKWRLNDGRTTLDVTVADGDFLRRVDTSEIAFSRGDILIGDVRVETRERPGGLHAEFFIERVIDHRKPAQQASLFGQDSNRPE